MSLALRITLVIMSVCGIALFGVTRVQLDETARRYREATEEPLVDLAMVLAAIVAEASPEQLSAASVRDAVMRAKSSNLNAKIYDLERSGFDLRVYVTDAKGVVIFDTENPQAAGSDYSNWNDVLRTLRGEYGARSSRSESPDPKKHSVLYVAAPIKRGDILLGSLTVGKPTRSGDLFARGARISTVTLGIAAFLVCALLGLILAYAVSAPVRRLTAYARDVRDGKRAVLPKLPGGEIQKLGAAFEEMRDALEGRRYVEQYVQTLAHALKSPLSGIRGAVELLREDLPPKERELFIGNISADSVRMQQLLDKLLALSTLQKEKALTAAEPIEVGAALAEAADFVRPAAAARNVAAEIHADDSLRITGNKLWIHEALTNLLTNAVEFSPRGGTIDVSARRSGANCEIRIRDHGPGIPQWAAERIFERFYSLPRPDTGAKSTGLGLSIVREVAALHSGSVTIGNDPQGGAVATLTLPMV